LILQLGWAALLALWLCYYFVLGPARELWLNYWLVGDGQQSVAVITHADWAGHGVFVYRYRANQKTYTGQDPRSYQNPKYANVLPGQETVVYFSSSHHWLSAINMPSVVMFRGLPVVRWPGCLYFFSSLPQSIQKAAGHCVTDSSLWRLARSANSVAATASQSDDFVIDKHKAVGWALLIVLAMAAIVIGVDALLAR
jgi:hypothetical protein